MTAAADRDLQFVAEALPAFISEAEEQLERLELLLLQLEDNPGDAALLNALFRCAHTVKGSAGVFGLEDVVAFTHHVETLLARLREGLVKLTPELSTLLLRCNDQVRTLVEQAQGVRADEMAAQDERAALVAALQQAAGVQPTQEAQVEPGASGPAPARPAARAAEDQRFIRVQASRLDEVINLLGELVIAGAGAALLAKQTRQRKLVEANAQISRLIEEIRNGTLQLRMVPIGETFSRLRRVVRDTAAALGKDVALELAGGDTELDKSVVERMADPLMHLVRNALDHGLETPEERVAAGKPAQGQLRLSARHEAGSVVICIQDDGRGIRRRQVLQRAWERGLVAPGVVPDDDAILQLVFEPGFSTAATVTRLSGRGVGMDVVRSNIEALRGSLTLSSTEGQGTCIEIRLPLTLAIIDGFLIGVGASKFVFPLDAVVEVMANHARSEQLDARGRGVVELRGQALPVVSLRALYALEGTAPARSSVVVLQTGNRRYGVLVDTLLGQHQTVIKPLARMFRSLRGMSGSSILGNGEVALIFDVHALSQMAAEPSGAAPERSRATAQEGLAP